MSFIDVINAIKIYNEHLGDRYTPDLNVQVDSLQLTRIFFCLFF